MMEDSAELSAMMDTSGDVGMARGQRINGSSGIGHVPFMVGESPLDTPGTFAQNVQCTSTPVTTMFQKVPAKRSVHFTVDDLHTREPKLRLLNNGEVVPGGGCGNTVHQSTEVDMSSMQAEEPAESLIIKQSASAQKKSPIGTPMFLHKGTPWQPRRPTPARLHKSGLKLVDYSLVTENSEGFHSAHRSLTAISLNASLFVVELSSHNETAVLESSKVADLEAALITQAHDYNANLRKVIAKVRDRKAVATQLYARLRTEEEKLQQMKKKCWSMLQDLLDAIPIDFE